jgi:hypothetical protein
LRLEWRATRRSRTMPIALRVDKHALLAAAVSLALAPSPVWAADPVDTWGKAGVSFEQYRDDAVTCGRTAHYADVSNTEHARAFAEATRRLEAADDHGMGGAGATPDEDMYRMAQLGARSEQIRSSIRPEKRLRELKAALVSIVERCLVERGYSRFRLTGEQEQALRRLKKGSPERHRFLHALASDESVLASQRIDQG